MSTLKVPIQLKRGLQSALPATLLPGEVYVCEDTGLLFAGNAAGTVIQVGGSAAVWGGITGTLSSQADLETVLVALVPNTITVNGHALSTNVVVSASDITTGTLPHAQLPSLVSGDIPANAANTSGTASNVSGTPALPNGTSATTQAAADDSTKLATTAYADGVVHASTTPSKFHMSGVTGFNAFGDSLTLGYTNASSVPLTVASNLSWPFLLSKATGIPLLNNFGLSGASLSTASSVAGFMGIALQQSPAAATVSIIQGTVNNTSSADGGTVSDQIISGCEDMAAFLALPATLKVMYTAVTFVGTWSNFAFFSSGNDGKYSSTAGDTATATVNGTVVYIGTVGNTAYAPNVGVTIDGVVQATFSETTSVFLPRIARYAGLAPGNHTVVVTVPSGSKNVAIQWMGGNGGATQTPLVVFGDTTPFPSKITAGNLADLNSRLSAMCTVLAGDGLNVVYVAQGASFSTTALPNEFASDVLHLNAVGQQILSRNYLALFEPDPTYPQNVGVGGDWTSQRLAAFSAPAITLGTLNATLQSFLSDKDLPFGWASLDTTGSLFTQRLNTINFYNAIALVGQGIPSETGAIDLTAQTAIKTATTLYTPAATGRYRITAYLKVTTPGTTSTLGNVTITFTDGTDSVAQSIVMGMKDQTGALVTTNTGNTTTSVLSGSEFIYAKTGVAIQAAIGYVSSGTAMQYEAHIVCETM